MLLTLSAGCGSSPDEASDTGETSTSSSSSSTTGAMDESGGSEGSSTASESSTGGDGDGDGDGACPQGNEGCPCFPNNTCFMPLVCEDWLCVDPNGGTDTTSGGDNTEPCCELHQSTGCEDTDVSACVCDQDDFCCDNNWDSLCVKLAHDCGAMCDMGDGSTPNDESCVWNTECASGFCYYPPSSVGYPVCQPDCLAGGGGDGEPWCDEDADCCQGSCNTGNGSCGN